MIGTDLRVIPDLLPASLDNLCIIFRCDTVAAPKLSIKDDYFLLGIKYILIPRLCTKQIALVDLQYEILSRITVTNCFLVYRGRYVCINDKETIMHLFVCCSKVTFTFNNKGIHLSLSFVQ